jgi:hypothetical protein
MDEAAAGVRTMARSGFDGIAEFLNRERGGAARLILSIAPASTQHLQQLQEHYSVFRR